MKKIYAAIVVILFSYTSNAQLARDYAVQITATTQTSPASITLQWNKIPYGTPVYSIYKKAKTATSWGSVLATISTGDTVYADNAVVIDSAYEYKIAVSGTGLPTAPGGYIYAGIKAPAIHSRGGLVLMVDSTFTDSCTAELTQLMRDISGDGWQIIRHDVARTLPDTSVKALIKSDYDNVPGLSAVLLVGHVAVPYSGDMNPDAHPDHQGAWPADVFYGNMTFTWTDATVNNATSANPLNHNIPGDGRWDHTYMPAVTQLQVSRFDFYDMPAFTGTEIDMMRRYLAKAHTYKVDSLDVRHRGLVYDNFGAFSGEAFAANGWRNFVPMVSRDSVYELPFIAPLADSSYQWAYGCGPGSYTTCGGIGSTANFASAGAVNAVFTMLFGSYFGDWNYQNSFLRAPLCADVPALTSCWAGRPNWFLHHMALGEHIGYSARVTQNNNAALYVPGNYGAGMVHTALLGDLTLRTDYIKQASNLTAIPVPLHGANLSWTASPDAAVIGYYVYRTDSLWGHYERISPLVSGTTFADTVGTSGLKYYMVRPVKLQSTPSGAYYNLGLGITDTATVTYPIPVVSIQAQPQEMIGISIFPNPAQDNLGVMLNVSANCIVRMYVVSVTGQQLYPATRQLTAGSNAYNLDISNLPAGVYQLCIQVGNDLLTRKWVKMP